MRCISVLKEDIAAEGYKILRTLDKVRCRIIDTADAGLEDKVFMNINNMDDYGMLLR